MLEQLLVQHAEKLPCLGGGTVSDQGLGLAMVEDGSEEDGGRAVSVSEHRLEKRDPTGTSPEVGAEDCTTRV